MNQIFQPKALQTHAMIAARICERDIPLSLALGLQGPFALAVITGVEGASYRPLGAVMVIDAQGKSYGNLSSGCIERDVAHHALCALQSGEIQRLRYGLGSPFLDLTLPCGGGLDIMILPQPDMAALALAQSDLLARRQAQLQLAELTLTIDPELRVLVFGKGPETRALSALACAAGYQVESFSPDQETLIGLANAQLLTSKSWPQTLKIDARTAIALFFHDHEWETLLLQKALQSQAFFIGAQGSLRAAQKRADTLQKLGVPPQALARLASPFGLIPSLRDPQSLAVSVLAQILQQALALK